MHFPILLTIATCHGMSNESSFAKGRALSSYGPLESCFLPFIFFTFKLIVENSYVYVETKFTREKVRRKNPKC